MSAEGNGRKGMAERLATDPVLSAIARLVQLVGLPVGAWIFLQVWNGLADIRTFLHQLDLRVSVEERRSIEFERRIDRVEVQRRATPQ